MTGPSRRARADGGRPHKVTVMYSELELGKVVAAAVRADLAPGAWLGEVGVRAADASVPEAAPTWGPAMRELMMLRAELTDARRVLRVTGGNLNDVAKHANSTGELHAATAHVQARVEQVVTGVEHAVRTLDTALSAFAVEVRQGAS